MLGYIGRYSYNTDCIALLSDTHNKRTTTQTSVGKKFNGNNNKKQIISNTFSIDRYFVILRELLYNVILCCTIYKMPLNWLYILFIYSHIGIYIPSRALIYMRLSHAIYFLNGSTTRKKCCNALIITPPCLLHTSSKTQHSTKRHWSSHNTFATIFVTSLPTRYRSQVIYIYPWDLLKKKKHTAHNTHFARPVPVPHRLLSCV